AATGGGHAASAVAPPERHAPGGRSDGSGGTAAAVAALPQGDEELATGPVPLLPSGGSAADQQRLGAPVRQPPLPRAAREWPQGSGAGPGCDRLGEGRGWLGDASASERRR